MNVRGQEKPKPEDIAHYGVRGMKWGVRRGGLSSRLQGVAKDNAYNREKILTRRIQDRPSSLEEAVASGVSTAVHLGKKRADASAKKQIKKAQDRQKRIEEGHAKVQDILAGLGRARYVDLVVSRRDNRG